jgi:hypothetical protein
MKPPVYVRIAVYALGAYSIFELAAYLLGARVAPESPLLSLIGLAICASCEYDWRRRSAKETARKSPWH